MGDLRRNFSTWEFRCKCGCGAIDMQDEFLDKVQDARDIADVPLNITSGYRCAGHNISVGGASDSMHPVGLAADILYPTSEIAFLILFALRDAGFCRFKFYPGHIHVDLGDRVLVSPMEMLKIANVLMWGSYEKESDS